VSGHKADSSSSERASDPGLYLGRVRHRRYGDPEHSFSYRVWHVLLDIEEIPSTFARVPLLSHNRFNLLALHDRDHMRPEPGPIRPKLERWLEENGAEVPDGRILLLTGLRHLGYGFNPLSLYMLHGSDGGLQSMVVEVNSTFGETFCYLLDGCGRGRVVSQRVPKRFHVSPFQAMAGEYRFRITAPAERLAAHIDLVVDGERIFDATLSSRRVPLTGGSLLRAVVRHGHLSALTIGRIHWQALRLWLRGARFHPKPERPTTAWRTRHG
jgi:DUF1365 family protein